MHAGVVVLARGRGCFAATGPGVVLTCIRNRPGFRWHKSIKLLTAIPSFHVTDVARRRRRRQVAVVLCWPRNRLTIESRAWSNERGLGEEARLVSVSQILVCNLPSWPSKISKSSRTVQDGQAGQATDQASGPKTPRPPKTIRLTREKLDLDSAAAEEQRRLQRLRPSSIDPIAGGSPLTVLSR